MRLLESTETEYFVTASPTPAAVEECFIRHKMRRLHIQDLEDIIHGPLVDPYPFPKRFDEAKYDPLVVLHTSGSTGFPKKIVLAQGAMTSNDAYRLIPSLKHETTVVNAMANKTYLICVPPFHSAGFWQHAVFSVYLDVIPIWPPLHPITADLVRDAIIHTRPQVCVAPTSVIADMVFSPSHLESLKDLECLFFGGSPLPKEAGDIAARKTFLFPIMGSTEMTTLPVLTPDQDDWEYFGFSEVLGAEFRHHWGDLYELVIVRKPEYEEFQGVFWSFPELDEFFSKDLYTPHPSKPGRWMYKGRIDDVVVFSNGLKINPVSMENIIVAVPEVNGALVVGQGYFQPLLLLEPKQHPVTPKGIQELIMKVWPAVQQANVESPAYGQIFRDFIMLTSLDKPMPRAGKGSVLRASTILLYEKEIDHFYTSSMSGAGTSTEDIALQDKVSCRESLRPILATLLGSSDFGEEDDIFSLGFDSLKVANFVRQINGILKRMKEDDLVVPSALIYANPTLRSLASALHRRSVRNGISEAFAEGQEGSEMDLLLERYSKDLPPPNKHIIARTPITIILTGSTGAIGSYLLHVLASQPSVSKIICLNRSRGDDPRKRQRHIMETNRLTTIDSDRIQLFDADLTKSNFGLPNESFDEMLETVTHIVHNAWEVNFNLSLQSFFPHIEGVRRLIDFSNRSKLGAHITFLSTIGTCAHWPSKNDGPMPEVPLKSWETVMETGYSRSKAISERLLDHAAGTSGVSSAICRIGQVAGPTDRRSVWNSKEWFPSLVKSSNTLESLPSTLGSMQSVDWIPIDVLAQSLVDITLQLGSGSSVVPNGTSTREWKTCTMKGHKDKRSLMSHVSQAVEDPNGETPAAEPAARVYHLVNPNKTTYAALVSTIRDMFPNEPELISLHQWVGELVATKDQVQDLATNPALKLLDFYQSLVDADKEEKRMVDLDTTNSLSVSSSLRELEAVKPEWIRLWMQGWGFGEEKAN